MMTAGSQQAMPHGVQYVAQHTGHNSTGTPTSLPPASVARVGQFLDALAATTPTLLRDGSVEKLHVAQTHAVDTMMYRLQQLATIPVTGNPHPQKTSSQSAAIDPAVLLAHLDSIRALWDRTAGPVRARWLMENTDFGQSGIQIIASALVGLVPSGVLVEPATRLANALIQSDLVAAGAAADTVLPHPVDQVLLIQRATTSAVLHRNGMAVLAMTQLYRGDTTAAMTNLRQAMAGPDDLGLRAAFALEQIATVRHDTTAQVQALSMLMMKLAGLSAVKTVTHQHFVALYPAWRRHHPELPADPERYLDNLFQTLFDRDAPVTRYTGESHHRLAIVEYLTGLHCGACWYHDRIMAALLQRYPADAVAVVAYQFDCPPLSNEIDAPQARLTQWYPGTAEVFSRSMRSSTVRFDSLRAAEARARAENPKVRLPNRAMDQWINGVPAIDPGEAPAQIGYASYVARIDSVLAQPPEAVLALHVTTHGPAVDVALTVDSVRSTHHRIAARVVLIEDTVRMMGATNRRLHYGVVRAAAHAPGLPMGIPLTGTIGGRQTARYHFDLATLAAQLRSQTSTAAIFKQKFGADSLAREVAMWGDCWPDLQANFPNPSDWRINRDRLHVIAFVQDLDTGEILQATRLALGKQASKTASVTRSMPATGRS